MNWKKYLAKYRENGRCESPERLIYNPHWSTETPVASFDLEHRVVIIRSPSDSCIFRRLNALVLPELCWWSIKEQAPDAVWIMQYVTDIDVAYYLEFAQYDRLAQLVWMPPLQRNNWTVSKQEWYTG